MSVLLLLLNFCCCWYRCCCCFKFDLFKWGFKLIKITQSVWHFVYGCPCSLFWKWKITIEYLLKRFFFYSTVEKMWQNYHIWNFCWKLKSNGRQFPNFVFLFAPSNNTEVPQSFFFIFSLFYLLCSR